MAANKKSPAAKTKATAKASQPANVQKETTGTLNEAYAEASDDERRVDLSPANTPGGSYLPATGTTEADLKKIEPALVPAEEEVPLVVDPTKVPAKVGAAVLYRVHPLDPALIKNDPRVEEADLLPAVIVSANASTADIEITLPSGRKILNRSVSFGGDSGQWRYGPKHAAVTEDSAPDAAHRSSFVGDEQVRENEGVKTPT